MYSTNPDSTFFIGEELRDEHDARPLWRRALWCAAMALQATPSTWRLDRDRLGGSLRVYGSDLFAVAESGRGRYSGHVFHDSMFLGRTETLARRAAKAFS